MVFEIIVSPKAQREIENAIDYYSLQNPEIPSKFIKSISESYSTLETNPFFSLRYKNIRALKINRFPFSLYYIVDEKKKKVRVLSCFHNKRDPNKRP